MTKIYTIYGDVRVSRRTNLTYVMDHRDQLRWTGACIPDALRWLTEEGETSVILRTEVGNWRLALALLPE